MDNDTAQIHIKESRTAFNKTLEILVTTGNVNPSAAIIGLIRFTRDTCLESAKALLEKGMSSDRDDLVETGLGMILVAEAIHQSVNVIADAKNTFEIIKAATMMMEFAGMVKEFDVPKETIAATLLKGVMEFLGEKK